VNPLERLLDLIALLRSRERPVTFEEIRREMPEAYGHGDHESAKRMFERDKEQLREAGLVLEMAATDVWDVEQGYVLRADRTYLRDLAFTPEEAMALFVAATGTGESGEARTAFQKLATGAEGAEIGWLDAAPVGGADASGPHLTALAAAVAGRRAVRFDYRRADGAEDERTLDPWGLVFRGSSWYVIGHDRAREDVRAFRLSRITSDVADAGEGAPPPDGFQAAGHVTTPGASDGGTARVAFAERLAWTVLPSVPAASETGRSGGWARVEVPVAGDEAFIAWVAAFGPDARLLEPERLRAALVAHLERVRDAG